ncbi:MAG: hypothetical protein OXE53_02495 [Deltaproteobacteria bacterium]|nr:hypothetical protein [Deltaproteobacteria bacterium]
MPAYPDSAAALRFDRVIHAIARSAEKGARVRVVTRSLAASGPV